VSPNQLPEGKFAYYLQLTMRSFDSAEEWHRLQEQYGRMDEDELQALADEAYELTDDAKHLLRNEISRRHLQIELRDKPQAGGPQTKSARPNRI
jgi:hypothetical protein